MAETERDSKILRGTHHAPPGAHRTADAGAIRPHHAAVLDTGAAAPSRHAFATTERAHDKDVAPVVAPSSAASPFVAPTVGANFVPPPIALASHDVASAAAPATAVAIKTAEPVVSSVAATGSDVATANAATIMAPGGPTTAAATTDDATAAPVSRAAMVPAAQPATATPADAAVTNFFTAGDLVISVYGDGDGSGTYGGNQAAPIVLEELTTGGTYVTQMTLSQTTTMVNGVTEYAVSGEYGSSSEGTLELSADGRSLVIAGYAVNADAFNAGGAAVYGSAALAQSTSVQGSQYVAVARVVADIGADGSIDSSTALYNIANTNNPRSVATVDGSTFYVSGQGVKGDTTQGVFVATDGASSATAIDTTTDTRAVEIYDGALYVSRDSKQNNSSSISSYGGLPNGSTTATVLPGIAGKVTLTAAQENTVNGSAVGTKVNLSPENYFFANSTTLYVADSGLPKTGSTLGDGGLQKWSLVGGTWTLDYTLSAGLNLVANTAKAGTTGLIGLTGKVVGDTVALYATNATIGDLDQTYVFGIADSLSATSNAGESFTTLMTAAADTNIRGIAFTPSADTACYAAGTMILTDQGERAAELLRAGDVALVPDGAGFRAAPIRWVGQRAIDLARHPDPARVRPVRFAPGAIAEGVPSRPLILSPDHALLLDNVLVPARLLVNGTSITVEPVPEVLYVHVELDRHDILLAENTPAESYLDTGNRHQFAGGDTVSMHPCFDRADHPDAFARLATDEATVRPIHERLAARAGRVASLPATTHDPALMLVLPCGRRLAPSRIGADGRHTFWLDDAEDAAAVRLCSRGQSPAAVRPWLDDRRRLGIGVGAIEVWTREAGLDPVSLMPDRATSLSGWWPAGEGDPTRWTDGEATLVLPRGCLQLDVLVSATTEYALAA